MAVIGLSLLVATKSVFQPKYLSWVSDQWTELPLGLPNSGLTSNSYPVNQSTLPKIVPYTLWKSLSHVWLFVSPWTVACRASLSMFYSPGQNNGVGSHSLLQGIVPSQGSNPGLPHCGQIVYHLSHQGSPRHPYHQLPAPCSSCLPTLHSHCTSLTMLCRRHWRH